MIQVPGSANLPPRRDNMLPEITPAKQAAEALKKLAAGRSRSTGKSPHEAGYILYLEDLTVAFDGFKAINGLTLYVETGELRCIIGPNGAGKTTMMDIITGKTRPDSGSAWFGQNLELALAGNRGVWANLVAKLSDEQRDRISGVLGQIGLADAAGTPAGRLSHGQKQWLEIGMLLMQNPRLLLVDEPVAGMTPQEVEKTAELLVALSGDHSVVVVEHDMEFVRKIAKRVTVLHQGSVLAEGSMDEVQANPKVVEVYLGEQ
jgi:urea transport system ATP-binding protein